MKSSVIFADELPLHEHFPIETVLLFDQVLLKNKKIKSWILGFKFRIGLKSGESLKTLPQYASVLNKISKMQVPKSTKLSFVALGGGSVGDFSGFLASTYLRGRKLIHIPSTWLAAMDSAHGGKNALNLDGVKNQIGTIYPASEIWICKTLLNSQPETRLNESFGEAFKMSLIGAPQLFFDYENNELSSKMMLKHLPTIIDLKNKIVSSDLFETKGHRRILNLGHTMGHVYEGLFGWPHGIAVLMGIKFSADWSFHRKLLSEHDWIRISEVIEKFTHADKFRSKMKVVDAKTAMKFLKQDKKIVSDSEIDFIFISKIGKTKRQKVKLSELSSEIERQKSE